MLSGDILAAAAINGKVYVVGGSFGGGFNSEVTDVIEEYDPATNQWKKKASMPTSRGGINSLAVGNCFYVWVCAPSSFIISLGKI